MKNIPAIEHDDDDTFARVAREKRRPRRELLLSIYDQVCAAYGTYADTSPNLEDYSAIAIGDDERDALLHCYETQTKSAKKLVRCVFGSLATPIDRSECSYCNIGEPTTLDHYLPKEAYPEFSVYSQNLVPVCAACNNRKGHAILTPSGVRAFLHTRSDQIDTYQFLQADIIVEAATPHVIYDLVDDPSAPPGLFVVLQYHFNCLSLADRYMRKGNSRILQIVEQARFLRDAGCPNAAIGEFFQGFAGQLPPNHWETALYRAASQSTPDLLVA